MKTPNQLADEIIQSMQEEGLSYDEMLQVIQLVRRRLEHQKEEAELNTPHTNNQDYFKMKLLKPLTGHVRVGFNSKGSYYFFRSRTKDLNVSRKFTSLKQLKTFLKHKGYSYEFEYTNEIIANAIELVHSGKKLREVARELRIPLHMIDKWYNRIYLPETSRHGYRYIATFESSINTELKNVA